MSDEDVINEFNEHLKNVVSSFDKQHSHSKSVILESFANSKILDIADPDMLAELINKGLDSLDDNDEFPAWVVIDDAAHLALKAYGSDVHFRQKDFLDFGRKAILSGGKAGSRGVGLLLKSLKDDDIDGVQVADIIDEILLIHDDDILRHQVNKFVFDLAYRAVKQDKDVFEDERAFNFVEAGHEAAKSSGSEEMLKRAEKLDKLLHKNKEMYVISNSLDAFYGLG